MRIEENPVPIYISLDSICDGDIILNKKMNPTVKLIPGAIDWMSTLCRKTEPEQFMLMLFTCIADEPNGWGSLYKWLLDNGLQGGDVPYIRFSNMLGVSEVFVIHNKENEFTSYDQIMAMIQMKSWYKPAIHA